jgi:transposase
MTMKYYVGLDVSVEKAAICVISEAGKVVRETSAVSHADDLMAALEDFRGSIEAIGLEAGPMSEFLAGGLRACGLNAILMETRRVHAAFSAIPVKTDRKDWRAPIEWSKQNVSAWSVAGLAVR